MIYISSSAFIKVTISENRSTLITVNFFETDFFFLSNIGPKNNCCVRMEKKPSEILKLLTHFDNRKTTTECDV